MTKADRIEANVRAVRERISRSAERAGRNPDSVRLIPVTKSVGIEEIGILRDLGFAEFGENRLEVSLPKIEHFGDGVTWHMIGHIQRRKARDVVAHFPRVDSVDRMDLAAELDKRCRDAGKTLDVLVQVNVSGESAKGGFTPDGLPEALEAIGKLDALRVCGLMTMAPNVSDPEEVRPVFRRLRELAEAAGLPELSMGMSNDFEVAIEEGATEVRIGTMLYN